MDTENKKDAAEALDVSAGSGLHWPCPNNCLSWCRTDGSKTNHHPRCEYVDESLIDVWRVTISPGDKGGCICGSEAEAREMAGDDPEEPMTITKERMHREIFENLPDFAGF